MACIFYLLALTALAWTLAYTRARLPVWTALFAVALAFMPLAGAPRGVVIPVWIAFVAVALLLHVAALRRALITRRVFAWFKQALPPMSRTEQEAIEAGTVWWDAQLFGGMPDWRVLLSAPAPRLNAEEQAFLDGPVETLCGMLDDWHITHERADLPPHVWQYIKEQRFFGMIIPKRYGGLEYSALAHSSVVMKLASRSITTAVTVMVPNSLGPAELLLRYGTDAQKDHYLPRLARGEEIPCFALTGPEAGSDASSIPDTGVVCRGNHDGEADVLGIRLTWQKRYITLGPVATVLGLAFKLYDPDHLLGAQDNLGITLALIPTHHPGVNIGRRHFPLNLAFHNGPNWGTNVFIPLDWVIGGRAQVGQGWRMLMECLAAGRSISLPALSTGGGKLAARATGAYARVRKQFKTPIGRFEGVEEALARIGGNTYAMDAVRVMTAGAVDAGEQPSVISAIAKYHLTERLRQTINDAMDVQGGSGICMGPRNYLGRIYQSIPISITVEGANILTRSLIIFGQGAIRCHPFVYKEMRAAMDPDAARGLATFDRTFLAHIGYTLSNAARALFLAWTGARFAAAPVGGAVARHYRAITRLSAALALCADVAMLVLGGALKRKERLSARLGDVLAHLYIASAVLKRHEDQQRPLDDLPLVHWACSDALHRAQDAMLGVFANFPGRVVALLLRAFTFPFGRAFAPPSDRQDHAVARVLLAPSPTRDRLTAGMFIPDNRNDAVGRLEYALYRVVAADVVERKLQEALKSGVISADGDEQRLAQAVAAGALEPREADILRSAIDARREVITVDDFAPEYLTRQCRPQISN
jgi:acyl-CoA dehydrogenase